MGESSEEYDESALRDSVFRLLGRREQSYQELRRKLIQKRWPNDMVDAVLKDFKEKGWQSDERFAEIFIREKVSQKQGRLKILAQATQQKGLSPDLVEGLLEEMEVDWFSLCAELKERRFGEGPPADQKQWMKQVRFLQQRGFSSEQIFTCVNRPES